MSSLSPLRKLTVATGLGVGKSLLQDRQAAEIVRVISLVANEGASGERNEFGRGLTRMTTDQSCKIIQKRPGLIRLIRVNPRR